MLFIFLLSSNWVYDRRFLPNIVLLLRPKMRKSFLCMQKYSSVHTFSCHFSMMTRHYIFFLLQAMIQHGCMSECSCLKLYYYYAQKWEKAFCARKNTLPFALSAPISWWWWLDASYVLYHRRTMPMGKKSGAAFGIIRCEVTHISTLEGGHIWTWTWTW